MAQMSKERPSEACVTRMTFRLPAKLVHRPLAIDLVSTLVGHVATADRTFRHEIVTAFGEAFNNIVIHGYRDRTDGMLDVEADLSADAMTLRLIDTGAAVDFDELDPPDLGSMPERGMGVYMIHALVDDVSYCGGQPNVLSLTKRTHSATPHEGQALDELLPHG
ncbi:MAG: ATP-binding protein [Labilithrix sp.]|nr:ATP-binding protein [Labilithrix sp.]